MPTFEDQLGQLETVVERLERGDLTLDESVRLFEDGVRLSAACKKELDAAEGRIQVLVETGGKMRVADLQVDDNAEDDEE
jgi:exodeoxyribonuclease VII small subunit